MFCFHKLGVKHDVISLKVIVLYANQLLKLCNVTLAPSISQEAGSHHLTKNKINPTNHVFDNVLL